MVADEELVLTEDRPPTNARSRNGTRKAEEPVRDQEAEVIDKLRGEVAGYYTEMRKFKGMHPDDVLRYLSAWAARAAELRMHLIWNEARRATAFRTKILDPFLDQCEFQFKIHSRIVTVAEMDLTMERGQT